MVFCGAFRVEVQGFRSLGIRFRISRIQGFKDLGFRGLSV